MSAPVTTSQSGDTPGIKLKGIALPVQHGGWGFLLEPIIIGFIAVPSVPAIWLSVAAFGAFLLHQPLKVAVKDTLKGKTYTRTLYARRFALLYAAITLVMLTIALLTSPRGFILPLLLAAPLGILQFWHELRNQGREAVSEVAGAFAFGSTAPAMALMAGWPLEEALVLWAVLAARVIPAIFYVRARLRLERGSPISPVPAVASHITGLGLVIILSAISTAPWVAILALVVLLARAAYGLSAWRKSSPPKVIGFQEIGYGLLYAVIIGLGYRWGL